MNVMMKDLKDYGAWALACHFFSKATGNYAPYDNAKLAINKKRNDIFSHNSEGCIPRLKQWWHNSRGGAGP